MIMGASATMGIVWLTMAQGMTDMSMTRLCTMPMASATPSPAPMTNPSKVAFSVTSP